jgi:hypothetical protein
MLKEAYRDIVEDENWRILLVTINHPKSSCGSVTTVMQENKETEKQRKIIFVINIFGVAQSLSISSEITPPELSLEEYQQRNNVTF